MSGLFEDAEMLDMGSLLHFMGYTCDLWIFLA